MMGVAVHSMLFFFLTMMRRWPRLLVVMVMVMVMVVVTVFSDRLALRMR